MHAADITLLTSKVKRWDNKSKIYIDIDYPTAVQEYNKSMGGLI